MKIVALLAALLVVGCATTEGYRKQVNALVGLSELDLVRKLGPPKQSYEIGGKKFLLYSQSEQVTTPSIAPNYTAYQMAPGITQVTRSGGVPSVSYENSCETMFELENGIVVSGTFRGNACLAKERRK